MADVLKINDRVQIPLTEFEYAFSRSSGPGGQHVNKVNSRVTLRWKVRETQSLPTLMRRRFETANANRITKEGEFVIDSQRYRDQGRNIADCLDKLRDLLVTVAAPPKRRRKTKPTRGSIERRLKAKQKTSEKKSQRRSIRRREE